MDVELKLPHCALPHVTLQVTPPFIESLVTVAAMFALPEGNTEAGGAIPCVNATVMPLIVICAVACTVFDPLVEAAVMVTVKPAEGAVAGAV